MLCPSHSCLRCRKPSSWDVDPFWVLAGRVAAWLILPLRDAPGDPGGLGSVTPFTASPPLSWKWNQTDVRQELFGHFKERESRNMQSQSQAATPTSCLTLMVDSQSFKVEGEDQVTSGWDSHLRAAVRTRVNATCNMPSEGARAQKRQPITEEVGQLELQRDWLRIKECHTTPTQTGRVTLQETGPTADPEEAGPIPGGWTSPERWLPVRHTQRSGHVTQRGLNSNGRRDACATS